MKELESGYKDIEFIIEKINKAAGLMDGENVGVKQAEEAILLYKSAAAACSVRQNADMSEEIRSFCQKGIEKAEKCKNYAQAKQYFEKKVYDKALKGFEQLKDYRDSEKYADKCFAELKLIQKKRIPYSVIVGMILPAILFFFLKEKADISIGLCMLIFVGVSALFGYAVYRNGVLSMLIEIASFAMLLPLLIFIVLVYVFHVAAGTAAVIAVGAVIALAAAVLFITERN